MRGFKRLMNPLTNSFQFIKQRSAEPLFSQGSSAKNLADDLCTCKLQFNILGFVGRTQSSLAAQSMIPYLHIETPHPFSV